MSTNPLASSQLTEDDARDLLAMFDAARTPEQFRHAMRIAKMRERSHSATAKTGNRSRRSFVGMVTAIPKQLRAR
jgi:hypothetical protein